MSNTHYKRPKFVFLNTYIPTEKSGFTRMVALSIYVHFCLAYLACHSSSILIVILLQKDEKDV